MATENSPALQPGKQDSQAEFFSIGILRATMEFHAPSPMGF
jgi:hypothetical protein